MKVLPPQLQARWLALAPRERSLVRGAMALVALALLWWVAIGPAVATLREADTQRRTLDAQLQRMGALQAQAQALQAQPPQDYDEALRALQASVQQRLGPAAQLSVVGERATVTLKGVPADALAQWLAQVRVNARTVPSEARLVPAPAGAGNAAPSPGGAPLPAGARPAGVGAGGITLGGPPAAGGAATPAPSAGARWDGTLVLALPPR